MRVSFSGTPDQVVAAMRKIGTPNDPAVDPEKIDAFVEAIKMIMQADNPRKIVAIKLYRKFFGSSLVDAKQAVEGLAW